jgi:membrane-bound lytic murein transglycosylase D
LWCFFAKFANLKIQDMLWSKGRIVLLAVALFFLGALALAPGRFEYKLKFKDKNATEPTHIPENLDFAGEHVPVEYFDIKESLDREMQINSFWQSQTILIIKKANRYFPEIEKILKEEDIPEDFKYLAVAESNLTNSVSPSNAAGFWQFLKKTAVEYDLEVNNHVDERYNLEKSTRAASRFFKDSYKLYGSWTLAAASYNIGRSRLSKQLEIQKTKNYYDLILNEETARYIFRILAIKIILSNPGTYGFIIQSNELYKPFQYKTLTVDTSITDMAYFASKFNTNYKLLKIFNPWLRDCTLINKRKTIYTIRIPLEGYRESLNTDSVVHSGKGQQ